MKLKIGMIVNYKPTAKEMGFMKERQSVCNIKEELPAVVVAIDENEEGDDIVNMKVLLDGQGDIWAKDVKQGDEVGEWKLFENEEDEETAFLNEINALIVKLAQQKKELEELSEYVRVDIIELQERALSINEDIEASKALLAQIKGAVVPIAKIPDAKKV